MADLERLLETANQRCVALEARVGLLEKELVEAEGGEVRSCVFSRDHLIFSQYRRNHDRTGTVVAQDSPERERAVDTKLNSISTQWCRVLHWMLEVLQVAFARVLFKSVFCCPYVRTTAHEH